MLLLSNGTFKHSYSQGEGPEGGQEGMTGEEKVMKGGGSRDRGQRVNRMHVIDACKELCQCSKI